MSERIGWYIAHATVAFVFLVLTAGGAYELAEWQGSPDSAYTPRSAVAAAVITGADGARIKTVTGDTFTTQNGGTIILGKPLSYWCSAEKCTPSQPAVPNWTLWWCLMVPAVLVVAGYSGVIIRHDRRKHRRTTQE